MVSCSLSELYEMKWNKMNIWIKLCPHMHHLATKETKFYFGNLNVVSINHMDRPQRNFQQATFDPERNFRQLILTIFQYCSTYHLLILMGMTSFKIVVKQKVDGWTFYFCSFIFQLVLKRFCLFLFVNYLIYSFWLH